MTTKGDEMSKDLLVLADEYAAATATFARALALKDEADSMSPIAREAGDKRAVLAEALTAAKQAQPGPVNVMLVEALETCGQIDRQWQYFDADKVRLALTAAKQAQPPAPGEAAREYMTGYSDGREWAKPSQALVVEPVYQYQLANGNWIDQTKESYDYNVKHGQATVRMLYATPQAAPLYAKEQQ